MFKGFDFIKNSFTASVSGSPSFLFPFIRNTSLRAAAKIPVVGGRSALNIPSTAVKQARGDGACMRRTLSGEAITAESCTFSVGLVNSRTSSGFSVRRQSAFFCRFFDPLDCFRIVQNCCKLCMFRQQVVFIWHGSFFLMLYFRDNDRKMQCNHIALNKIKRISGIHIRDIRKWNSRWCGRFRPLQSFPCTA